MTNTFPIIEDVEEPVPPHLAPRQRRIPRTLTRSEINASPADAPYAAGYAQLLAHPGADTFGSLAAYAENMRLLEKHGAAEHARLLKHCKANDLPIDPRLAKGPEGSGRARSMTAKLVLCVECYGMQPRNLRWLEPQERISASEAANCMDYFTRQQAVFKGRGENSHG